MTPAFTSSFEYDGKTIMTEWFDLVGMPISSLTWQQVYVIGDLDGSVPVVVYPDGTKNLPGGKTEQGETVDQTLRREVREELNMHVIDWQALGYQRLIEPDGKTLNQLRVYAKLEKIGEFVADPGGSVAGNELVGLDELNDHIHYDEATANRMIKLVRPFFDQDNGG